MADLVKEERYIFYISTEQHVLRVEELVSSPSPRPEPFRLQLPASNSHESRRFYGITARGAVEQATDYISLRATPTLLSPKRTRFAS